MTVQIPAWIQEKVDEIRLVNRLAFGGFTMTAGAPEGGAGGDGDQGGQDDGDLFDDPQGGDGDEGGDDGGDGGEQLSPALQALIAREANRIADQRINQVLQRQRGGQQQGQQQGTRQQQGGQQQGQQQPESHGGGRGASPADVREARMVYREYVGDKITFVGDEERQFAADLAAALLPGMLEAGADVETAGQQVATQVAERVKSTRQFYQRKTIKALQQRGVLPEDFRPGQPPKGTTQPGGAQSWKAGEERARAMYGDRIPQGSQQN